MGFLLACCLGMFPWIVFLGITLPDRYRTDHWSMAWTGFDIALLISPAATAWANWRRRQVAIAATLITGRLLICDAWFDLMFSLGGRDFWVSLLTAVLGELPLAGLRSFLCRRLLSFSVQIVGQSDLRFRHGPSDFSERRQVSS